MDAILRAKVVVVFAEEIYFRRWYCLRELLTALAPFDALLRKPGTTDAEKSDALSFIIVALPSNGARPMEMNHFPPLIRSTAWPLADDTDGLVDLISARLKDVTITIGDRLDALGQTAAVRAALLEESQIPHPKNLVGSRIFPLVIPGSIGRVFVGRANDLWRIHTALSTLRGEASASAALTGALEGGGGFGKTRLSLEYLHRFGPLYYPGGLFWVDADVEDSHLEERFHGILKTLKADTPDIVAFRQSRRSALKELAQALHVLPSDQPVLYIVDNVPEPQVGNPPKPLSDWCPAIGKVALLATSRAKILAGGVQSLPIDALASDSAVELLTRDAERKSLSDDSWRDIAEWVGNLPLALELLNCALRAGVVTATELLAESHSSGTTRSLDKAMEHLRDKVSHGSLHGVTEALDISYRKLLKDGDYSIQKAARLIAMLSPEPIPMALIEALGSDLFSPAVRSTLVSHSMVSVIPGSREVPFFGRMHRVLADFLRTKAIDPREELRIICEGLISVMDTRACTNPKAWPLMVACLPHAEHIFAQHAGGDTAAPECLVHLGLRVGIFLYSQGLLVKAKVFEEKALELARVFLGEKHPATMECMNHLAVTFRWMGRLQEARILHEKTLDLRQRILGEEHLLTLESANNLAVTLRDMGEVEKARAYHEKILRIRKRTLGNEHPDTLSSMNNLAETLRNMNEIKEARALHEKTLNLNMRTLGKEHPETLRSMNNLALTLRDMGEVEEARALQEKVLELSMRILGEEHPHTLQATNNLAELLRRMGRLQEARALHEKVIIIRKHILGEEHHDTLQSINNLAETLRNMGEVQNAKVLHEKILELRKKILGEKHPDTLQSINNLAETLRNMGEG